MFIHEDKIKLIQIMLVNYYREVPLFKLSKKEIIQYTTAITAIIDNVPDFLIYNQKIWDIFYEDLNYYDISAGRNKWGYVAKKAAKAFEHELNECPTTKTYWEGKMKFRFKSII